MARVRRLFPRRLTRRDAGCRRAACRLLRTAGTARSSRRPRAARRSRTVTGAVLCKRGRAEHGGFHRHPAWACMRLPCGVRRPVHFPRSCVRREPACLWGRQERGMGRNMEPGRVFEGPGGFRVSPSDYRISHPLLQFVRSGVGVILTSPSLLVEGVRSGSPETERSDAVSPGRRGWAATAVRSARAGGAACVAGARDIQGVCTGKVGRAWRFLTSTATPSLG